ncbi:hypothetical protein P3T76_014400 [Phytophthora citrophthora]|uniref:Uncharacterized protein n=1 Tax=Phytophthora citrophthora TaxID=4793 RepID=A0AAD9G1F9_9STRA|nr:hypothetical protein P3T76_014400 [Phytophthora citrophthora]
MSEHKNVAYRASGSDAKLYYFTWDAVENRYEVSLRPSDEEEHEGVFDSKESGEALNGSSIVCSYLFASPHAENYQQFAKEKCVKVYMNP